MGDDNTQYQKEFAEDIEASQASMMRNYSKRNLRRLLGRKNPNKTTKLMRRMAEL